MMAKMKSVESLQYRNFARKLTRFSFIFGSLGGILLFLGADILTVLLTNEQNTVTSSVVRILSIIPLLSAIGNLYGVNVLLTLKYEKIYLRILLCCTLLHLLTTPIFILALEHTGAALSVLVTQILISVLMYYAAKKRM